MSKIRSLTQEQWNSIPGFIDGYVARASEPSDKDVAERAVLEVYARMDKKKPIIIWGQSPIQCYRIIMDQFGSAVHSIRFKFLLHINSHFDSLSAELRSQLDSHLRLHLHPQLYSPLHSQFGLQLDSQLRSHIHSLFYSRIRSFYICTPWMAWSGYYRFAESVGVKFDYEKLALFMSIVTEISVIWPFEGICFVSEKPVECHWNDGRLHNEVGKSVRFSDGWGWCTWKGVKVPDLYIEHKDRIDSKTIASENNLERRRAIQEILGDSEFAKRLELVEIDSDLDEYGKPMGLFKTRRVDKLAECNLYFLKVTDTSTDREYYLSVPQSRNVWEARAHTFCMTAQQYRPDVQS